MLYLKMQINIWSECCLDVNEYHHQQHPPQQPPNSNGFLKTTRNSFLKSPNVNIAVGKNELADWFVDHKVLEYLFGPNLHVEVVKRSQDIVNFMAFSNRLNEAHLDIIWSSAQVFVRFKSLLS
jgi:hypothetical protein